MGISVSTLILIVLSILSLVEIALVITSLYSENDYVIVFSLIPVVFFCILILAGAYSYCIDFENKNNNKNRELKTIQRRNKLNKGKIDNSTTSKNVTGILEQIESFIYQNKTQDKGKGKGQGKDSKNKDNDLPNTKGIFDSLEPTIIDTESDTDSEIDSESNLDKVKNKNKDKNKDKDKDNDYNNIDDDFNPNRGSPGLTQMLIDPGTI